MLEAFCGRRVLHVELRDGDASGRHLGGEHGRRVHDGRGADLKVTAWRKTGS